MQMFSKFKNGYLQPGFLHGMKETIEKAVMPHKPQLSITVVDVDGS